MIVIAYDGSRDSKAAIERAAALMPAHEATVVTVWQPFLQLMSRSGAGMGFVSGSVDYDDIDRANEQNAGERAAEGAELGHVLGLTAASVALPQRTTTAEAILSKAREIDAEAIIVGSRGLSGIKSLLLGSVSHAVVHHADRPVLVVRAEESDE